MKNEYPLISVIIPAYNEAKNIEKVQNLRNLPGNLGGILYDLPFYQR